MNKGIIIGILVVIVIGIGVVTASQNYSDEPSGISIDENIEYEPKQITVGLSESVGFTEGP